MSAVSLTGSVTRKPAGTAEDHLGGAGGHKSCRTRELPGIPEETLDAIGLLLAEAPTSGYLAGEIPVSWRRCRDGSLVPVPLAASVPVARS